MKNNKLRSLILKFLKEHKNRAYKQRHLFKSLKLAPQQYNLFKETLKEMAKKGEIEKRGKHNYGIYDESELFTGTLSVKSKGFGIVTTREGEEFFIGLYDMRNALDGDIVKIALYKKQFGPRREARVVEIVQRIKKQVMGTVEETYGGFYCYPLKASGINKIFIASEDAANIVSGELALVAITSYPSGHQECVGKVVRVIGNPDDPINDFETVRILHNLPEDFPRHVIEELETVKQPEENDFSGRKDLRDEMVITIDPEDAKDFDDAISLEPEKGGGWRLGVHISDVSFFVPENSKLDKEAQRRGTSVYLINHVIPMLPEKLSNDLCSLKEGADRLTQTVFIGLSRKGKITGFEFADTVIRNRKRLSYEQANRIIEKKQRSGFSDLLIEMNRVAELLYNERRQKGSIDFDLPEPVFHMDGAEIPSSIQRRERLKSHRLIEEFMLAANRCVAEYVGKRREEEKLPFIYRIHEKPEESDLKNFLDLLRHLGINYQIRNEVTPADIRNILEMVEKYPFRDFIEKIALRTMTKALYSHRKEGHFGLAFPLYTHFTSPIRRYPDLVVHRLLRKYRNNDFRKETLKFLRRSLPKRSRHMSETEKQAEEAEREFILIKQLRYIEKRIGENFMGIISGVTDFGMFVELEDSMVEGYIHVSKLMDDYYEFIPELYTLKGRKTKKTFRLGDRLKVKVESVDIARRRANFLIAGDEIGQ